MNKINHLFFGIKYVVQNYLTNIYLTSYNSDILGAFLVSNDRLFASTRTSYQGFGSDDGTFPYAKDRIQVGDMDLMLSNQINLTFKDNPSYILLVKQITDFDNREHLGTLYLAVNISFFEKILEDLNREENTEMWLMDKQGKVFYHTDTEKMGETIEEINQFPLFNGSFRTNVKGQQTLISLDEGEEFSVDFRS